MKRLLGILLAALLLSGCFGNTVAEVTNPETTPAAQNVQINTVTAQTAEEKAYISRFASVTEITLSDDGITVNGGPETEHVFTSRDIIYYEDRDAYESGKPYGEGEAHERHSAQEAEAHTVVNITAPGAYRVSGKLSAGQIRVDLGDDAYEDSNAVAELILDNADITCTVAPAILFLNTYECDGNWSAEDAKAEVDTSAAGANLILEGSNTVSGSHVAKIFKDKDGEKKQWKQDGAVYSYMSLNVFGPGSLDLTADNEGLDTELHLTINGGSITIRSDNDGINTNEDGVSVTTINAGNLRIIAGLGAEGDGIDSNGYLVINGGTVVSSANPAADAGLDSDLGSYIHGGTVIAFGSTMDWAESDSDQVTMNLQFARQLSAGSKIVLTRDDGTEIFSFEDDSEYARAFSGLILSHPNFAQGDTYHVYIDGVQMAYTGTDVGRGGFGGGKGGKKPEGMNPPEGFDGQMPEDFAMPEGFEPGQPPEDFPLPEGETMPEGGFGRGPGGQRPEGFDGERPEWPEGETFPEGQMPEQPGGTGQKSPDSAQSSAAFYMADKVNAFSGVTAVTE